MVRFGYLPSGSLLNMEIEALCALLGEIGYKGIELLPDLALTDEKGRHRLLAAVEADGLTISEVVLQRDFVSPDPDRREQSVKYIIDAIPRVGQLGVDTVNLFTGPVPWTPDPVIVGRDVSQSQAWEWVFSAFDRILPVAEEHNMRIAVENVWGMLAHDLYTHKFLQNRYDSPLLGVNLDPSHDILYGNTDMRFLVDSWGRDKIFHVHLKDAVGVPEQGKFVFPLLGEGNVDWTAFFGALDGIGYDGFASVEFESWNYLSRLAGGSAEKAARTSFDAIKKLTAEGR